MNDKYIWISFSEKRCAVMAFWKCNKNRYLKIAQNQRYKERKKKKGKRKWKEQAKDKVPFVNWNSTWYWFNVFRPKKKIIKSLTSRKQSTRAWKATYLNGQCIWDLCAHLLLVLTNQNFRIQIFIIQLLRLWLQTCKRRNEKWEEENKSSNNNKVQWNGNVSCFWEVNRSQFFFEKVKQLYYYLL